jgi:hypothetical protein
MGSQAGTFLITMKRKGFHQAHMKLGLLALVVCLAVILTATASCTSSTGPGINTTTAVSESDQGGQSDKRLARAFAEHESHVQVEGKGRVTRLLADDNDGSPHQRFIVELRTGQTLLIAHNIDLAPRIDSLEVGDEVEFSGEYEWNAKGGTIHWTHHDPKGRHVAGWLKHAGRVYQ